MANTRSAEKRNLQAQKRRERNVGVRTRVKGAVKLRAAVPGGSVFIAAGTHDQPANALTEPMVEVRKA